MSSDDTFDPDADYDAEIAGTSTTTSSLGGEARDLLGDPPGYIREIVLGVFVGGLLSALTYGVQLGLDITAMFRGVLERSGGAILSSMDAIWNPLATLAALPLETVESVAVGAGPFAPIVAALAFAMTAAIVAGIVWGLFRVVRFI